MSDHGIDNAASLRERLAPVTLYGAPLRKEPVMATKTTTPTMIEAEQAADILGLDVFDLAVCLRRFAVDELEAVSTVVRKGEERPNLGRFQRLLRAAEACEAAWDDMLKASEEDDAAVA